jgi:hypothetical protein
VIDLAWPFRDDGPLPPSPLTEALDSARECDLSAVTMARNWTGLDVEMDFLACRQPVTNYKLLIINN